MLPFTPHNISSVVLDGSTESAIKNWSLLRFPFSSIYVGVAPICPFTLTVSHLEIPGSRGLASEKVIVDSFALAFTSRRMVP